MLVENHAQYDKLKREQAEITQRQSGWLGKFQLIAVIAVVLGLVFVSLYLAERLNRFLGVTGRALLTRLLGVLLAALSVQFVVDGVKSAFAG